MSVVLLVKCHVVLLQQHQEERDCVCGEQQRVSRREDGTCWGGLHVIFRKSRVTKFSFVLTCCAI